MLVTDTGCRAGALPDGRMASTLGSAPRRSAQLHGRRLAPIEQIGLQQTDTRSFQYVNGKPTNRGHLVRPYFQP